MDMLIVSLMTHLGVHWAFSWHFDCACALGILPVNDGIVASQYGRVTDAIDRSTHDSMFDAQMSSYLPALAD